MAKLAVVFVLALFALQNSSGSPVQRNAWNVFQYVQFVSYKIDEELKKITTHLPEEIQTFSDKINIIFSTHNIQYDIAKFKQDIKMITKEDVLCSGDIDGKMNQIIGSTLKDVQSCEESIQSVADSMEEKLKATADKAHALDDLLKGKIVACAKDHLSSYDGMKTCLDEFVLDVDISRQLQELIDEVEEVLSFAVKSTEGGMEQLEKCVVKVEKNIKVEEDSLVRSYQTCVSRL